MKEKSVVDKVYTYPRAATMPTLLKFQNGELAAISKESTQFSRALCKTADKNRVKSAIVVSNDQIYHGIIDGSESQALTDTYICVRNKITNKVRIIPIEQATLTNTVYNTLERTKLDSLTEEKTRKLLLKKFGGRKASRYLNMRENMNMSIDLLKDELDKSAREASLAEIADENACREKNYDNLRPKFNKDAKNLHEVYDVKDVIPAELLERLEEEAKVVYATPVDKLPIDSEYLTKRIQSIQEHISSNESFLNIKIIIYMDCLMNLIKMRSRSMRNVELSRITEKVENDVQARFFNQSAKTLTRSASVTEKALCYFIVLALLLSENFSVDLSILSQELGTSQKKLKDLANIVNARLVSGTNNLTLRLPSTMPPLTTGFRRAKK